ncbi:MAG: hypothetical protein EXR77_17845 [Myxococcales bacterium]|nr:hypothetical protein [Myxococcales bacterium]
MGPVAVRVVASAVRGPAHVRNGLPCQDAWLAVIDDRACMVVVCDGMGSRANAAQGAQAGVLAARDAWRWWRRWPAGKAEDLVRLLEIGWRLRTGSLGPDSAAATCLLYAQNDHRVAVTAQLGDGLIARIGGTGTTTVHPSTANEFGETHALGTQHQLGDWSLASTSPLGDGEAMLLATDGVSDDLDRGRLHDVAGWVRNELGSQPWPNRSLAKELRNWPVPYHQDDKTLLVLWQP